MGLPHSSQSMSVVMFFGATAAAGMSPNWAETFRIDGHTIWNVNVSKQITDNAEITLYVNNVLDDIHPEDDTFNSYPYFWRAFSPVGREVFVEFSYLFN